MDETITFVPAEPAAVRRYAIVESPFGDLVLSGDGRALNRIDLVADVPVVPSSWVADRPALGEAIEQLRAYFAGERDTFALRVAPEGTPFQLAVWRRIAVIPYGVTVTYGELARDLGHPRAARAVGAANGANPLPIVLPCHRVIAASGDLVKYGLGGLPNKRHLLDLEGRAAVWGPRGRGGISRR